MHLAHILNLIATADTDLFKFDVKSIPKKNALRQALSEMQGLWNKNGRSVSASEEVFEVFGNVMIHYNRECHI